LQRKIVKLSELDLPYDYLVVALGSTTNYFKVPGAEENTFPVKTIQDALEARDHIIDVLEHADHEEDLELKRELLTFVVVGGGYTGVEVVTELHDFIHGDKVTSYRGIDCKDIKILLVEAGDKVLEGFDPTLADRAQKRLLKEGIEIRTKSMVTRCFSNGIEINNKEIIKAGIVIWAAGVRANPVLESLPVKKGKFGRILVNDYLQVPDFPEIYAIGDNAMLERGNPGKSSQPIAPVAIHQGRVAAQNIVNTIGNKPLIEYSFAPQGMLVSLGTNDAVITIKGRRFSGFFAWLFWNAVHLLKLVGFKKQVQVFLDWMLATVFPRDSAILRFPQKCPICAKKVEAGAERRIA
ncbi:MAG TPA: FAD-dependent oxidoreductase, partial [Thermodesulfobacteriota bacterium]|nr:FAD-dependent oxidoreductase [Thermodesulfobacteriota bacterium]